MTDHRRDAARDVSTQEHRAAARLHEVLHRAAYDHYVVRSDDVLVPAADDDQPSLDRLHDVRRRAANRRRGKVAGLAAATAVVLGLSASAAVALGGGRPGPNDAEFAGAPDPGATTAETPPPGPASTNPPYTSLESPTTTPLATGGDATATGGQSGDPTGDTLPSAPTSSSVGTPICPAARPTPSSYPCVSVPSVPHPTQTTATATTLPPTTVPPTTTPAGSAPINCGTSSPTGWPTTTAPINTYSSCLVQAFRSGTAATLRIVRYTTGDPNHPTSWTYEVIGVETVRVVVDATKATDQPPVVTTQVCSGLANVHPDPHLVVASGCVEQ
jgi:hypothetical protein